MTRSKALTPTASRIADLAPFRGCSPADLQRVDRLAHVTRVAPGTVLATEGALARESFVIIAGEADVSRKGQPVTTIGPGHFLGEMGFLDDCRRSASVEAATEMELLVFDRRGFADLLDIPAVSRMLLRDLSRRLRSTDEAADS
jgi:CRP-like cAMP-binding protein